jgi:uncharacterized protein with von Willebrand factor type A (vWA) domain
MRDGVRAGVTAIARLFLFFVLLLAACSKPVPDESALRADDKRELERLVAMDVRASQAMREADDASMKPQGDGGGASDVIARKAKPAIDIALSSTEAATMKTEWGRAKKDALLAVLRDRKAELPKYEEAAKSSDPDKMLAAITAQADIERRALAVVAAVQEGR